MEGNHEENAQAFSEYICRRASMIPEQAGFDHQGITEEYHANAEFG
jgi:hypothetical protein